MSHHLVRQVLEAQRVLYPGLISHHLLWKAQKMQKQRSDVKGCVKHTTLSPCPALFHPCNTQMITVGDCVSCSSFEDTMAADERSIWGQKLKTFRLRLQAFEVLSYFMLKFDLDTSLVAARIRQNLQTFGSIPSARNYQFPYFCCS